MQRKQNTLQQSGYFEYFCNSKNSEKLGKPEQFIYQSTVKISEFFVASVIFKTYNSGRKSFCFQQDQTTIIQEDPKGFAWHKY